MSKKPQPASAKRPAAAAKPGKGVATIGKSKKEVGETTDLKAMMEQDAGKGVSTLASDNVVPLVYLLQALSPQCVKQSPKYVSPGVAGNKGAEAGNIWFRGSKDLIDGEETGMRVQLCHFRVVWVQWGPERGDGLRGRHDERPKDAVLTEDPKNPKKKSWVLPNDDIVVETREHVVLVHDDLYDSPTPVVIPMSGSNHQPAKQWMTDIGRKKIPDTDSRAPLWAYFWRMKTVARTDGEHNWFSWSIEDEDEIVTDVEHYKMAKQLHQDFDTGVKRADTADDDPDTVVEQDDSGI